MPWTADDARRFNRDLTAHQRIIWARVANRVLMTCQADGGSADDCEARAVRQASAVAGRAPAKSIKVGQDGSLSILAIPFGGPFDGKDFDGEFFSPNTELCLDWFPNQRPLLYEHGMDDDISVTPIGTVDVSSRVKDAAGWWVRAQLDKSARYWRQVSDLLAADDQAIFASSAAMPHLVRKANDGEILRWPWVELSLTPNPSNFFAIVEPATAKAHYKAAGLTPPPTIDIEADDGHFDAKAELTAAEINNLPDSAFAVILPGGEKDDTGRTVPRALRKLPHHNADGSLDMPHLRNALSREPQSDMPADAHARAHAHLMRHMEGAGMDKSDGQSFADELETALAAASSIVIRCKSLADLRGKEGRPISTERRKRMAALRDMFRSGADELDAILKETEPLPKAAPTLPEWSRYVDEFRAQQAFYGLVPAGEK